MPEVSPLLLQSSPSKRELSTSAKSPPAKKLKSFVEELIEDVRSKMPGVEAASNKEVLKEVGNGNSNKGSPVKAPRSVGQEEVNTKLYFVKMTEKAHVPTKGSKLAAGYDLKSAYKHIVPARGSCLVKTDIQIKLPSGTYGRVAPRSGLALKHQIDVGAGVIDEDYRGNVGVILFNHGDKDFDVNEGDRVAQLICEKIQYPEAVEVENLDNTERGEGGFGSTGVGSGGVSA